MKTFVLLFSVCSCSGFWLSFDFWVFFGGGCGGCCLIFCLFNFFFLEACGSRPNISLHYIVWSFSTKLMALLLWEDRNATRGKIP